jgi:hypothetical protein
MRKASKSLLCGSGETLDFDKEERRSDTDRSTQTNQHSCELEMVLFAKVLRRLSARVESLVCKLKCIGGAFRRICRPCSTSQEAWRCSQSGKSF